jgi:hypothetical protein
MEKTNQVNNYEAVEKIRVEKSILRLLVIGVAAVFIVAFLVAYNSQSYFLLKLLVAEVILSCVIILAGNKYMSH